MVAALALLLAAAAAPAPDTAKVPPISLDVSEPEKTNRWFIRLGGGHGSYNSSAWIAVDGSHIPGSSVHVTASRTIVFDLGYDVSDNISVMVTGGIPPKAKVIGRGTVASYGKFGRVWFGPAIATAVYRLPEWHGFRPYAGVGVAHLFILKEYDGAV